MVDGADYLVLLAKDKGSPVEAVYPEEGAPIINSPTGTARIPKNAACWVHAARPVRCRHRWFELESVITNRTNTATAPSSAPSSGRLRVRVTRLTWTSRSSWAAGAVGASGHDLVRPLSRHREIRPPRVLAHRRGRAVRGSGPFVVEERKQRGARWVRADDIVGIAEVAAMADVSAPAVVNWQGCAT